MSRKVSVWTRTARVEHALQRAEVFALAQRLATELGISADELLAGGQAL